MGAEKLRDVMAYLCSHYPYKGELSKARVTKMVYLADWRMCLTAGHQITQIRWIYNHYGPYVDDVATLAWRSPEFAVKQVRNAYGSLAEYIEFRGPDAVGSLTETERLECDFVIQRTKSLNFAEFINLVYSTYPVASKRKYSDLDLERLAAEYKTAGLRDL